MTQEGQKGMVLRIERSSIHDGDGLRTVVFLKGCPLTCQWCSTPESQSPEWEETEDKIYGEQMSVKEVMKEVEKDSVFFFHSEGGMTLSGGEPLLQADFSAALLRACREVGIHTAMETSLFAPLEEVEKVLPNLDTLYGDLKFLDGEKHREYCGHANALILDNFRQIARKNLPIKRIIRIPLIPGINDDDGELEAMAAFCGSLDGTWEVELLPYHRLGVSTYGKLGRRYLLGDIKPQEDEQLEERREYFFRCMEKTV